MDKRPLKWSILFAGILAIVLVGVVVIATAVLLYFVPNFLSPFGSSVKFSDPIYYDSYTLSESGMILVGKEVSAPSDTGMYVAVVWAEGGPERRRVADCPRRGDELMYRASVYRDGKLVIATGSNNCIARYFAEGSNSTFRLMIIKGRWEIAYYQTSLGSLLADPNGPVRKKRWKAVIGSDGRIESIRRYTKFPETKEITLVDRSSINEVKAELSRIRSAKFYEVIRGSSYYDPLLAAREDAKAKLKAIHQEE